MCNFRTNILLINVTMTPEPTVEWFVTIGVLNRLGDNAWALSRVDLYMY